MVWLWSAGSAAGVTGSGEQARESAARFMGETSTATAVVEQAFYVTDTGTLTDGYEKAGTACWIARRRPGGPVTWQLHWPEPRPAVA
jgi:hypothetical protein